MSRKKNPLRWQDPAKQTSKAFKPEDAPPPCPHKWKFKSFDRTGYLEEWGCEWCPATELRDRP